MKRIVTWAETRPDIRAAALVGSQARTDRPADEWSDLDIIVIATDAERYLSTTEWLQNIGTPWITFLEGTALGNGQERRVLFEGGLDVDFVPLSQGRAQQILGDPRIATVIRRGVRVLLDKDGELAQLTLPAAEAPPPGPPAEAEFLNAVNDFWYHAVWTAKKLRRGELWTAKSCCDSYMKNLLLRMIEWHAHAAHGWDYDTWHSGRFLEHWADPRVVEGLRDAFAHYDTDDIRRGLLATMDLFRWLAMETARSLGYPYPAAADERVTGWVMSS